MRRRKDGSTFPSASTWVGLNDDRGALVHLVAVERDITQETQVREQMIHTERLAAVGQLASGVAHELNNPLQAIVGFTELLMAVERREEARADLQQIRSEAHRAAKIIRNLLAFVRRSGGERALVAIDDLVRTTVALRKYELATANIDLHEDYGGGAAAVLVNREEIQQVVLNLLLNAEQALLSAGGNGQLWVRTAIDGSAVVVDVRDNGPGVPAALAGRVFEPFFSTKPVGQGTGLGLSIALGIAEAHRGGLRLVPTEAGAEFQLTLPIASKELTALAPEAGAGGAWSAALGRRALVVDDEPPLRELLQRMLRQRGFLVDSAEDGRGALVLIEQNRYDVVFCDIQMPQMSGMALYDTVRERRLPAARRFVFLSGDILNPKLQSFVDAVQLPMLAKPFDSDKLGAAFEALVAQELTPRGPAGTRPSRPS
jgi:nitrogen-specific signal transduction histidine kinase/ActR/RegA family two-component response regulator